MAKTIALTIQLDKHLSFCTVLSSMNPVARLIEKQKGAVQFLLPICNRGQSSLGEVSPLLSFSLKSTHFCSRVMSSDDWREIAK